MTKRHLRSLSPALLAVASLAASCSGLRSGEGDSSPRPNVILFLVDDLGWQDTEVPFHSERTPFNERYATPHMQRLADEGLVFTDAYAASPVCTPTRTALVTGQSPARTRITNWTLRGDRSAKHDQLASPPWNLNGLSDSAATPDAVTLDTLPALLQRAGYKTIHVGKAHFGSLDSPGQDPLRIGFTDNVAGHAAGGPASHLGTKNYAKEGPSPWNVPGLEAYHGTEKTLAEALTLEAEKMIDVAVANDQPFFLNMAHYAVHAPIEPDPRYVQAYLDRGLDEREARYASMIEGVDDSLGRILAKLDEHGIADETIVLYLSDNGGLSAHARGGERHTHNAPLSSGKGSAREGGVRVPMIARWPGHVPAGERNATPVISHDVFPTVLAACGIALPAHPIDGVDLAPLFNGSELQERDLFWHYPHQWGAAGPGIHPFSSIRRGHWKLIHYYAEPRVELFDLAADLGETTNLAELFPERVRTLSRALAAELEAAQAQTPLDVQTRYPRPLPGS